MKTLLILPMVVCNFFIACTSTKPTSQKNIDIAKYSSQLPDSLAKKQLAGIDFFANGNTPVTWSLDMDFDNTYDFNTVDGIHLSTQALKPTSATDAATTYSCNTSKGPLKIIVYTKGCDNSGKTAEVVFSNIHYTGCGKNLYDYRLNDSWVLESVGNIILNGSDFSKGLPHIAFSLAEKNITGSDGCNNITIPIEVEGNRIQFGTVAGSKNSCKNNSVQKIFREKISNNIASYFFRDGKLYLYLIDDSMLIFKKAN